MGSSHARALSLYHRILRAARTFQGEERTYILQEARDHFKANANLTNPEEIEKRLREGEDRLEVAIHYRIPYPRLHHAPQYKYIPPPQAAQSSPQSSDPEIKAKLEAAQQRRRQQRQKENSEVKM